MSSGGMSFESLWPCPTCSFSLRLCVVLADYSHAFLTLQTLLWKRSHLLSISHFGNSVFITAVKSENPAMGGHWGGETMEWVFFVGMICTNVIASRTMAP